MAEREEGLKRLLIKVEEESEKVGLKLNIQKTKIMAFGPLTSWQIDGETMETVADLIWGGSKITQMVMKIMAFSPLTSWQIDGGNNGNSDRLNFGGLQNHADGDCSHEIKRQLLLRRKAMT